MMISIASGKGGTGKTTVATNLALFLSGQKAQQVQFLDCDVEEPNAHVFLEPDLEESRPVSIAVPNVDLRKCTLCRKCAEVCAYNAIVVLKKDVLTFPELCHGCGGCSLLCPEQAISERERQIGVLEQGRAGSLRFVRGRLNIGEPMATPVIRAVKKTSARNGMTIIDVPPGTSCPVLESVKKSDYVILVTEPTPFGLNDLKLAVGMIREIGLPFGVLINRSDIGDNSVAHYCDNEMIEIIASIPDSREIAERYSKGEFIDYFIQHYSKELERRIYSSGLKTCFNEAVT